MKSIPTVQRYMSTAPHTIGADQSLREASERMREHGVRHLPVMRGESLVGILSERDVALISGLSDVNPEIVRASDAMTEDVITVSPDAQLDEVATMMAERRAGSVIVEQNHKLVGIFTTVDALRAFAELLHSRLK
jgi:acetoin utilization protein AcuB